MEDIKKKYPIVDLSKFTFNKNILSEVVTLVYKTIIKFFAKFCSKFTYVGPKKIWGDRKFFLKDKKS